MMATALLIPLFIPFVVAMLCVFTWKRPRLQGRLTVVGMIAMLVFAIRLFDTVRESGIIAVQAGGWTAPFGITLAADMLSAIMVVLTAIIGLTVGFYSIPGVDSQREEYGYYPLFNFLIFGVCGSFLAGDIFNLYVWFEVMLISSFVLLSLGGMKRQLEGAIKYVTLNFISSAIFLAGVGTIYSITGTLNFADLAVKVMLVENKGMVTLAAMFFLVSFGIKAAVFPLFFWLPASYHTPPVAVAAVFSGLLTKVGVYALLRTFTLIFITDTDFTHTIILVISAFTMVTGVLGAAIQFDFRRVLSFHIVSQIGYMLMGLALFSPIALAGTVFYLVHHIIVKTNLFLISGLVHYIKGSFKLKYVGGVYRDHPWLAFMFLVPALSLAGLPPFSGFWAKFILVKASIDAGLLWIMFVALAVSLLTLYSMTKIWNEVFWTNEPEKYDDPEPCISSPGPLWVLALPSLVLTAITLYIGFNAGPFYDIAMETAQQLLDRDLYISTILQRTP